MAGKGYPTISAAQPLGRPDYRPDYRRPGPYDRRPLPRVRPLTPWRPKNPLFKPPARLPKPFGRKPIGTYPSPFPSRFPRVGRWFLPLSLLPFTMWQGSYKMPAGWIHCWGPFGKLESMSGPTITCWDTCSTGCIDFMLGGQVPSGEYGDPIVVPNWSGNDGAVIWFGPGVTRMTYVDKWRRPGAFPGHTIPFIPGVVEPDFPLDADPNWWLPLVPTPWLPYPRPVWRPKPEPRTWPRPETGPNPEPRPDPRTRPDSDVETEVDPRQRPHERPRVRHHPRTRPGRPKPRVHENKYTSAKGRFGALAAILLRMASRSYGGITEVVDLIASIYGALPPELLAKFPHDLADKDKLPFMLGAIWRYRDQIDYGKALHNYAVNGVEDWIWGKYFQAIDKVSRKGPYYQGFDVGLGDLNDEFMKVAGDLGIEVPTDLVWWLR